MKLAIPHIRVVVKYTSFLATFLLLFLDTLNVHAQSLDPNVYYRLTTEFRGPEMCLDVFNGGEQNNMTHLTTCANYSGQQWRLLPESNGRYRLTTEFRGAEMCLDIFNGGEQDNQPHLAPCGNFSGQFWHLRSAGDGRYRLTTDFRGPEMCLDIFNGGKQNNQPHLTPCANYTGQIWNLTASGRSVAGETPTPSSAAVPGANTATSQVVKLRFLNASPRDIDVYFNDEKGETQYLATVKPGYQLTQPSPVGVRWHVAQDDQWKETYETTSESLQVIRFGD